MTKQKPARKPATRRAARTTRRRPNPARLTGSSSTRRPARRRAPAGVPPVPARLTWVEIGAGAAAIGALVVLQVSREARGRLLLLVPPGTDRKVAFGMAAVAAGMAAGLVLGLLDYLAAKTREAIQGGKRR